MNLFLNLFSELAEHALNYVQFIVILTFFIEPFNDSFQFIILLEVYHEAWIKNQGSVIFN